MKKPTNKQIAFAGWLITEDNNSTSPLVDKVFLADRTVYRQLKKISNGKQYSKRHSDRINRIIRNLNKHTNGYITDNWNNED